MKRVTRRLWTAIAVVGVVGLAVGARLWFRNLGRQAMVEPFIGTEVATVYWLRRLASVQGDVQRGGLIDADSDGIGEFATILELTGSVGVRSAYIPARDGRMAGVDLEERGKPLGLDILAFSLSADETGIADDEDYLFRVFLPDNGAEQGWVHEAGPRMRGRLAGGTGAIGIDRAETVWRAVGWPAVRGKTGNRAYFVDESGVVLESENVVAMWSGRERSPTADCALPVASGGAPAGDSYVGRDGDRWIRWDRRVVGERMRRSLREGRDKRK